MIETSKKQLQHQQELIEKQLKRHEHKKSQKKLQKILRRQQREQERQQREQEQNNLLQQQQNSLFFQSNELIISQLIQQSRLFEMSQNMNMATANNRQFSVTDDEKEIQSRKDKISTEPIFCTVENCNKTFRKQSLLDYHLKYHHYITNTPKINSTTDTASTSAVDTNTNILSSAPKKRRLSSSMNDKLNRKKSFLKLTSLNASLNLTKNSIDENAEIDVDDNDDVFIGDLIGLSDLNDEKGDPYEVIHCKCGTHTSNGFMIQVIILMKINGVKIFYKDKRDIINIKVFIFVQ